MRSTCGADILDFVLFDVGMVRVATQQGKGNLSQMWKVQFEKLENSDRWTNPLMVWRDCNRGLMAHRVFLVPPL